MYSTAVHHVKHTTSYLVQGGQGTITNRYQRHSLFAKTQSVIYEGEESVLDLYVSNPVKKLRRLLVSSCHRPRRRHISSRFMIVPL